MVLLVWTKKCNNIFCTSMEPAHVHVAVGGISPEITLFLDIFFIENERCYYIYIYFFLMIKIPTHTNCIE